MYWLGAARRPGLKQSLRPGHGPRRAGGRLLRPEAAGRAFGPAEAGCACPKAAPRSARPKGDRPLKKGGRL